ncbi:hypothetical protein D8S78_10705 [Natrialba swarupiae]|nr:hypothetical protein [Natrialba swarupiae]
MIPTAMSLSRSIADRSPIDRQSCGLLWVRSDVSAAWLAGTQVHRDSDSYRNNPYEPEHSPSSPFAGYRGQSNVSPRIWRHRVSIPRRNLWTPTIKEDYCHSR